MKLPQTLLAIAVSVIVAATCGYLLAKLKYQRSLLHISEATSNRLAHFEIRRIAAFISLTDGRTYLQVDGRLQEFTLELVRAGSGNTPVVRLISVNGMMADEILDASTANGKELISSLHAALNAGTLTAPSQGLAEKIIRLLDKGPGTSVALGF